LTIFALIRNEKEEENMIERIQPPSRPTPKYSVTHQGATQGPFELDFIEAMIMAQVYPRHVLVQKVGSTEWVPFNSLAGCVPNPQIPGRVPSPSPTKPSSSEKTKPKKPSETAVALAVGVFVVLVGIWIVVADNSSKKPQRSDFASTPGPTPTRNSYSQPVLTSPSPARPSPAYSAPRASASPSTDSTVYRDASGRTYRVSNSDYRRLSAMQTSLSFKQSSMQLEEERLTALAAEVDRDRITLDRYNQYSVDAFNRKVNQVNAMNDRVQSLVKDYNRDVDAFNTELERVGTPIN
jgi:hypothetical protein